MLNWKGRIDSEEDLKGKMGKSGDAWIYIDPDKPWVHKLFLWDNDKWDVVVISETLIDTNKK
jgi:hypothetical protein